MKGGFYAIIGWCRLWPTRISNEEFSNCSRTTAIFINRGTANDRKAKLVELGACHFSCSNFDPRNTSLFSSPYSFSCLYLCLLQRPLPLLHQCHLPARTDTQARSSRDVRRSCDHPVSKRGWICPGCRPETLALRVVSHAYALPHAPGPVPDAFHR